MQNYLTILFFFIGFIWVVIASNKISQLFLKIKLPLITGFLLSGVIVGPFLLNLIPQEAIDNLNFVNDFSLAFIAFAAGAELYLKELRGSLKSIAWNTFGQFVITFIIGFISIFFLSQNISFMQDMTTTSKIAVSLIIATIFIARSPSSAIAVINEMRAKGPFTKTAISVTVVIDILVIVLFALIFSISNTLITGISFRFSFIFIIIFELILSLSIGFILGKILIIILSLRILAYLKSILILLAGYGIYVFSSYVHYLSDVYLPFEIHIEPLLACLTGSFLIINYSKHRTEFHKLLHDIGPMIYAVFFTLAGAMISLDILIKVWTIALLLFAIRIFALIIGTYIGTTLAGNPKLFKRIGWAPYVTQAGIAFAIVTEVATEFSTWGNQFATIVIAVIVLNQIVGPPLFKWAIKKVGESRLHAKSLELDIIHKAIIFGFDDQSLALARELKKHNWIVKIACLKKRIEIYDVPDIEICFIDDLSIETFDKFKIKKSEAIVLMLSDEENYTICESVYENIGTKEIIVRLHNRDYFNRFHELGAIVIDPSTAMINLLDHFVRSPMATSLLLGMEDNKDTLSQEVLDKDLHGVSLRNLRLPSDVLILSVKRKGQMIISHGYTRLRLGDIVTIVGSPESLEIVRLRFEK